jgi:Ni,Fe-hydrogenase I large subunit
MAQIIVDPLTRIEGHLKVTVNVNTSGTVTDATAHGTMARGLEKLLQSRDSRDAPYVTERICGVCFTAHGLTSSMAVETAHGTTAVPDAARLIRNLIAGGAWLHDHPLHFYHLSAVDYLDMSVLTGYTGSDSYILKLKELITNEISNPPVEGGYAGPFLPTYEADEYCVNDLDTVVTLVQHYLSALQVQAKAKKMSAIFGGKQPHQSGIIPGGVTQLPDSTKRTDFRTILSEIITFVQNTYVPDVLSLANGPLLALAKSTVGVGYQNYLSYGGFPETSGGFLYPEGAIINGVLTDSTRTAIESGITEDVTYGWYTSVSGGTPAASDQVFDLTKSGAYTFVKAPRYQGQPMEVGPLARLMVALMRTSHTAYSHTAVQQFKTLLDNGVQPGVVARHAARALETLMLCDAMTRWLDELDSLISAGTSTIHDTTHWDPPATATGFGLSEAPRGALGHWVSISSSVIQRYACVVPTTWNASPKDASYRGPIENALLGCPVPDTDNPINVGRIVRSFDPCLACAVHLITPKGDIKKFDPVVK